MISYKVLLKIILFVVVLVQESSEEVVVGFNDGVTSCRDFDNDHVKGDSMKLSKETEDGNDQMALTGSINCLKELTSGHKISIEIAKETDMGSEAMWSCTMDLCEAIEDKDAPWAAMFEAMNVKSCPIAVGEYEVQKLVLDTGAMKSYINEEYIGEYEVWFAIKDDMMETIACHTLFVAVKEDE